MKSLVTLTLIVIFWIAMILGCSSPNTNSDSIAHGNEVEYRHGSKIVIQPFADRDEIHYYQSELKTQPDLLVSGKIIKGHSFELGSSASCKLSARPPAIVTFDLIHDTPSKSSWHFPPPGPQPDIHTRNSTVQVAFITDGQCYDLQKGAQIELTKDDPHDPTFYEVFITEIPLDVFLKIANGKEVQLQMDHAGFTLDSETVAALHDFADIIKAK
jgi:hypothetical protein